MSSPTDVPPLSRQAPAPQRAISITLVNDAGFGAAIFVVVQRRPWLLLNTTQPTNGILARGHYLIL